MSEAADPSISEQAVKEAVKTIRDKLRIIRTELRILPFNKISILSAIFNRARVDPVKRNTIASETGIRPPNVSTDLKPLIELGFVTKEKEGFRGNLGMFLAYILLLLADLDRRISEIEDKVGL